MPAIPRSPTREQRLRTWVRRNVSDGRSLSVAGLLQRLRADGQTPSPRDAAVLSDEIARSGGRRRRQTKPVTRLRRLGPRPPAAPRLRSEADNRRWIGPVIPPDEPG